jgi:hypothetical protein
VAFAVATRRSVDSGCGSTAPDDDRTRPATTGDDRRMTGDDRTMTGR